MEPESSVVPSEWKRQWTRIKIEYWKTHGIPPKHKKTLIYCENDHVLKWVEQRSCVIHGDNQNLTGHGPGQPALFEQRHWTI